MRATLLVFACAAASALAAPALAQERPDATLGALLDRAARYTHVFVQNFSNVVAEERYVQDSSASQGPKSRTVWSDFLLGGEATYGRFRRFGVTTDETISPPR